MPSLRRFVRNTAALAGGLTAFNVWQNWQAGPLMSELPGRTNYWRSTQGAIFYKTHGDGDPVVLLHGFNAGASSYEMRRQVAPLAERFQVYAPDWLGFGLSDRPNLVYTADVYTTLLGDFLRAVVRRPAHLVASSIAAAYAIHVAAQSPDLVRKLVLIAPTGIDSLADPPSAAQGAFRRFVVSPVAGQAFFNALASKPSLRYFLKQQAYEDPAFITDEMIGAYFATTHQPGARFAPASFVSGYLNLNIRQDWTRLSQPALLVWGANATSTPVSDAEGFTALKPGTRLEVFDHARLLPHDEHADRFNALVRDFLVA